MLMVPFWCDLGNCSQTEVVLKLLCTPALSLRCRHCSLIKGQNSGEQLLACNPEDFGGCHSSFIRKRTIAWS